MINFTETYARSGIAIKWCVLINECYRNVLSCSVTLSWKGNMRVNRQTQNTPPYTLHSDVNKTMSCSSPTMVCPCWYAPWCVQQQLEDMYVGRCGLRGSLQACGAQAYPHIQCIAMHSGGDKGWTCSVSGLSAICGNDTCEAPSWHATVEDLTMPGNCTSDSSESPIDPK